MDTFKGQDIEKNKSLILENNCELVIVTLNSTNNLRPLDITISQKAKKFVSSQFNSWYAERVRRQLTNGKSLGDVKVSVKVNESRYKAMWGNATLYYRAKPIEKNIKITIDTIN